MSTKKLLDAATVDGAGSWINVTKNISTVVAKMSAVANAGASFAIQWTPDGGTTIYPVGTLTPTGTGSVSGSTFTMAPGEFRAVMSGLTGSTGTGLSATVQIRY